MTPSGAAALWPELEAIADEYGLELVRPAVNFSWGGGAVTENDVVYTDPGTIYTHMSSYDDSFYHGSDTIIEAEQYTDMNGIHLTVTGDQSGVLAADDFDSGDWMQYNVRIETTAEYSIQIRMTSIWESYFSLYDGSRLLGTCATPITASLGTWETISYEKTFQLTQGEHQLKVAPHGGGFQLNWFRLTQETNTSSLSSGLSHETEFTITPNPATDRIHIYSTSDKFDVALYSLSGIQLLTRVGFRTGTDIDLAAFSPGVYILMLAAEPDLSVQKIILQ